MLSTPFLDVRPDQPRSVWERVQLSAACWGWPFTPIINQMACFLSTTPTGTAIPCWRGTLFSANDPNQADPNSATQILTVEQPYANHNGGDIAFGRMAICTFAGDGGSGGDPQGNGQNLNTLLGSILRADVDYTVLTIPAIIRL